MLGNIFEIWLAAREEVRLRRNRVSYTIMYSMMVCTYSWFSE